MKRYYNYTLKKTIAIRDFKTVEYLHLQSGFRYPEETHDFYEMVYVEQGFLACDSGGTQTLLAEGELFLIPPGRPHSYRADSRQEAVVFIICFQCTSSFLHIIEGRSMLGEEEKTLIGKIFSEAKQVFTFPFRKKITLLPTPAFGAQQVVGNALEELFIRLIRSRAASGKEVKFVTNSEELEKHIVADVVAALEENLFARITLDDLEKRVFYSKTYLNNLFKKYKGNTIIRYYTDRKIKEAIKLIEAGMSFSEVAERLCFDNPNYFSKVFKRHTGLTPSAYKHNLH